MSYRCRGRRSIDSRTAISFRIKATAGRLQTRTHTSESLLDLNSEQPGDWNLWDSSSHPTFTEEPVGPFSLACLTTVVFTLDWLP